MGATAISDIIVPEVFAPYMVERTTELSKVIEAGIAQRAPEFDAKASSEGLTVEMPFWDDLTGDSEVLSDSGALTVNAITADKDIAATNFRGKAWGANDLTGWVSGDDPMGRIADATGGFWARDMQRVLMKILAGLFDNTNGVLRTTHRLNIYSDVAAGSITDAMRLTGETFISGLVKLGDANQSITAVAMHSETEAFLRQRDLIDTIPDSEGKAQITIFQGRRVIVDDNCPKTTGTNSYAYTTYMFGTGAFAWGERAVEPRKAVEPFRQELNNNDVLITRHRFILHPRGVRWVGTPAGPTPSNAEFATGTNWQKAFLDKNIKILAVRGGVLLELPRGETDALEQTREA